MMKKKSNRRLIFSTLLMAAIGFSAASVNAATLTTSVTAPTIDGADIAHLVAIAGREKLFTDTRAVGQTFLTGSEDVSLDAITLQLTMDQQTQTSVPGNKNYTISIGTVVLGTPPAGTYTQIAAETVSQTITINDDEYLTFTLDTPLVLTANTLYGFDLAMTSDTAGWQQGIPYMATADGYANGEQFRSQTNATSTPAIGFIGSDKIFHLNLSTLPPPEDGLLAYSPVRAVPVGGGFMLIALGLLMAGVAFLVMRRSGTSGHMAAIMVLAVGGLAVSLSGANLVHKAWAGGDMITLDIPSGGVVDVPPGDWTFVNNTGIDQTIMQLRLPYCDNIFVTPFADTPSCEVGLVLADGDMCTTSSPLVCAPGPVFVDNLE